MMIRKWVWLLGSGLIIASVVGCGTVASPTSGNVGVTSQPYTPTRAAMASKAAPEPTNVPPTEPSPRATGTPQWTAVPITPTQIIEGETMKNSTPIPTPADPGLQKFVMQAKEDLAKRLNIAVDQIELVELQAVTWPDASLGCPKPGMGYIQVQQDGLLIRLRADGRIYEYHSGGGRPPFLCE
jgi:hypothetical protein